MASWVSWLLNTMLRITNTGYESLRVRNRERLTRRLADWLKGEALPTPAATELARVDFVARTLEFADAHAVADEDALQQLLRLRARPEFVDPPTAEQRTALTRPGFSDLQRVDAYGRQLVSKSKLRRVTLDMDFAAERRRRD